MNALLRHVAGEGGSIGDVAKVGVRTDVTDRRREIRCPVDCQRQGVALTHGDVDELQVALFPEVRQPRSGIERGTHDRQRMGEQLHAALAGGGGPCGLWLGSSRLGGRQESTADVVGDIAVQCLVGAIEPELSGRRCEHEVHLQALLHARAPVLEVDRSGVFEHLLPFLRGCWIAGDVPAAVEVRQFAVADDLQRLDSHQPIAATERVSGARHELEFRSRSLAGQPPDRERRHGRHRQ